MRGLAVYRSAPLLPVILLLSTLLPGTQGFFPSDFREKYFGNGGVSHEAQTRQAYDTLAEKYFPDISPITLNMIKARTTIAEANMKVDDDQDSSAKHFDGENFVGGQALLVQGKKNVIDAVKNGDGEAARNFLGAALHTLQDFYAHTNWVELGRSQINFDLGDETKELSAITFPERTCNECGFGGAIRLLLGCHDCTTNTNGFSLLTSGYYEGEDSPADDADIPDWKCRHGGATDSVLGAVAGAVAASALRDVTPGINKDSLNCFWSPHHFHHSRAVDLAIKSSIQYIEDIIEEGEMEDKERRILFGVGTSLAFAIDTTGSMASIIAATRQQAIAIARGRLGTKDEPIDYVVVPFNDPSTGPVSKRTKFDDFVSDINGLGAFGGGDCPELAISGILQALDVMEGPSDLFIMTDATAKDYDMAPLAIERAFDKQIRFHVFKYDSNCDDGLASKRDGVERRADSVANQQYSFLAASTGGTYYSLPASEAGNISSLIDSLTLSESNTILKTSGTINSTSSFDIPVDSRMTEFTISLRGSGVTLSLTKPDGSALDLSSNGVTLTTVSNGQFLGVKAPSSGVWSVTVNLTDGSTGSTVELDVSGVSPLHLSKFNFVKLSGRPGHKGYFPLTGQPAFNHDVAAVAVIDGAFESAVFDLRNALGAHAVDTNMVQGTGAEGAPPTNSFYGEMRLLNESLYAYVEGTDDAGAPFQRVLASVFQPVLSNTTDTGFNNTDIFAGINMTNITSSSSTVSSSSSTSIILNSTSSATSTLLNSTTTLPPYPTSSGSSIVYPTGSGSVSSKSSSEGHYYSGYPVPVYTWDHTSYEATTPGGGIKTHTKYATAGCDKLKPFTYTTTATYTITDNGPAYTTVSEYAATTYIPSLCATCTGDNYPHHTGKGPWKEEDKSVVESGYGEYVTTVSYEASSTVKDASVYSDAYPTTVKDDGGYIPSSLKDDGAGYSTTLKEGESYPTIAPKPEYSASYEGYPEEYPTASTKVHEDKYPTSVQYNVHEPSYPTSEGDYNHNTDVKEYYATETTTCTKTTTKAHGDTYPIPSVEYSSSKYADHETYPTSPSLPSYPPYHSEHSHASDYTAIHTSEVPPQSSHYDVPSDVVSESTPSYETSVAVPPPHYVPSEPVPSEDTPATTAPALYPSYPAGNGTKAPEGTAAPSGNYTVPSVPEFTGGAARVGLGVAGLVGALAAVFGL